MRNGSILTNISANSNNTATDANHGALASRAATTRPILVPRVKSSTGDVVDCLAYHQSLRDACLHVENRAGFAQEGREYGITGFIFSQPGDVSHGCFKALDHVRM